MKVAIVGAGIIGITTAWELASDGHEVVVFERRGAAAEESSFANAGVIAPGYVSPWAGPGMRGGILRSLLSANSAITLRWPLAARDMRWMTHWRRACKLETYLINRARMQRLALYSHARLHEITTACELEYERSDGYLVLLRSKREKKLIQPGLEVLRAAGTAFREVDADEARTIEPALSADTTLAGGAIHLPNDEVANCRQFALLLKWEAEALGAQFHFNCDLAPMKRSAPTELSLASGSEGHRFDAVVVCAGVASAELLRPLGLRVPLAPVYGHSISASIRESLNAPRSAVMDERYKVAISRLGLRVRVAGSAELGGSPTLDPASLQTLYKVLQDWFPGAVTLQSGVQQWKGARPMLPDGPPIIGPSGVPGIWLNLGHGSSGWALSCGSARVLADLMAGRDPGIDLEGLGIERLLHR